MATMRCGKITSCALYGIQGIPVEIEVTVLPGLPAFDIVGLGDSAVRESRNRVHAAIKNTGFDFPASRVTACYAPAWLRKEGSAFDLPLALAILMATGQVVKPDMSVCAFGELSLSGEIRSVPGAICRAASCREYRLGQLMIPTGNSSEALAVYPDHCLPVAHLRQAAGFINDGLLDCAGGSNRGTSKVANAGEPDHCRDEMPQSKDISSIIGQVKAVRAMQIAAAGRHNLLLLGSPGCGKSSLAAALPGLLPPLNFEESLQVTRIYSASGLLQDGDGLVGRRPFRMPHHSISRSALVGGGSVPVPGEISLAHTGVLFLDEMTEFHPEKLDLLRQPLEEQVVRLSRLRHSMTYPADFMLVGAANPCRCGEYLETNGKCRCSPDSVRQHLNRLSGPLMDRIDLVVEMVRLTAEEMRQSVYRPSDRPGQSADMLHQIQKCWQLQMARCQMHHISAICNARLNSDRLAECLDIPELIARYAAGAASRLQITARGYQKILRVSRTIADLDGSPLVREEHVSEAMQYRLRWPA